MAPTPSGYLHVGNAANFALTWLLVRSRGGSLRLRIDDLDGERLRPAYLEDIFRTLDWLGLDWDLGPTGPDEHLHSYSQHLRIDRYRDLLAQLVGQLFACDCSRRAVAGASPDGQYPGTCRDRHLSPDLPGVAWRFRTSPAAPVCWQDQVLGRVCVDLHTHLRDFVVRRRDQQPAYQIASLADDLDYGTDLIVRGADLLHSTAAQLALSHSLGAGRFGQVQFWHHPLLSDAAGHKLSKSAGSLSLQHWRAAGLDAAFFYTWLAQVLGLPPARSASELLAGCQRGTALRFDAWQAPVLPTAQ